MIELLPWWLRRRIYIAREERARRAAIRNRGRVTEWWGGYLQWRGQPLPWKH